MGYPYFLQGIFPTQESNLGLLHCRPILHRLSHEGSLRRCLQSGLPSPPLGGPGSAGRRMRPAALPAACLGQRPRLPRLGAARSSPPWGQGRARALSPRGGPAGRGALRPWEGWSLTGLGSWGFYTPAARTAGTLGLAPALSSRSAPLGTGEGEEGSLGSCPEDRTRRWQGDELEPMAGGAR